MIKKILVANRGEIACRVFKTAKRLGIKTVAVFSDADKLAQHVKMADEAIYIGASPAQESYLNIDAILNAVKQSGADAVHPGYGFLSENADFAEACENNDTIFIGPPSAAIHAMGSKSAAKRIMEQASVPLVPGYHEDEQTPEVLMAAAESMGFPVLLKATAGGGGRGMRPVYEAASFMTALTEAQREAKSSFGDSQMLVEKYLPRARHVEVQIFCDKLGNGIYLGDRDCSVQRRHQKVVEEAPAPDLSDELRENMGEAAVRAAKAIDYHGAGTVEFLVESTPEQENFYFMEMNTRLQVEHPVTEYISGTDLVEWQIQVAEGQALALKQHEVQLSGHAIEVRVYAESPYENFCPSTGTISYLQFPEESEGLRIDSGFTSGDTVSAYYDAMLAKIICHAPSREVAIRKLQLALEKTHISGLKTNVRWLTRLISSSAFIQKDLHTQFLKEQSYLMEDVTQSEAEKFESIALCWFFVCAKNIYLRSQDFHSPWQALHHWRLNSASLIQAEIQLENEDYTLNALAKIKENQIATSLVVGGQTFDLSGSWNGRVLEVKVNAVKYNLVVQPSNNIENEFTVFYPARDIQFKELAADHGEAEEVQDDNVCKAPMNARVMEVCVTQGQAVDKGQALLVLEAMKMEYTVSAPHDGYVETIFFSQGELVERGSILIDLNVTE